MSWELNKTLDSVGDGIKETAEILHTKTNEFHENYVSKVLPDCGKYGDEAKFVAEMVPGIEEYNAIKDGDWQAFAIAAGIDIAAVAIGAFTAGAGYATVKGGTNVAKAGVKVAAKEIAEVGAEKAIKEVAEAATEKAIKETAEAGAEKAVKETIEKSTKEVLEAGVEKTVKETAEAVTEKTTKEVGERTVLEVGDKIDKTRFPEYIDEIEKITNREISPKQRELIEKNLKENDYEKLSKADNESIKKAFKNIKNTLIDTWEKETGEKWPQYTEDVLNDSGEVIRRAGERYDVHHIIETSTNGPNEWWNIHPAKFPNEHQRGIHAIGSMSKLIFG